MHQKLNAIADGLADLMEHYASSETGDLAADLEDLRAAGAGSLGRVESPHFVGVLETVLYHDGEAREDVERFYGELLGLPTVACWEDGVAFRIGAGVLLVFDLGRLAERPGMIAEHGTSGPGHVCLRAGGGEYERWREHLQAGGVEIVHDHDWGRGRSFYFKDPAGNLLEIADSDIWPQPR